MSFYSLFINYVIVFYIIYNTNVCFVLWTIHFHLYLYLNGQLSSILLFSLFDFHINFFYSNVFEQPTNTNSIHHWIIKAIAFLFHTFLFRLYAHVFILTFTLIFYKYLAVSNCPCPTSIELSLLYMFRCPC
jgi:hypothetical protein